MTVSRTICLGFIAVILAGTLLLMLPISTANGTWNAPIVALFTSTSAVCVTGHIVVDTATHFSPVGQFFIMALVQVGGLGYMTATTFLLLLIGRKFNLKDKIALQQALDRSGIQGAAQVVRSIIATTLLFEISGIFLLLTVFAPKYGWLQGLWLATFHSVSAWNNAGFSLFSDNLIGYQSSVVLNLVIPGLIIFGGIGYEVIFELYLWLRAVLARKPEFMIFSLNFKVATSTTLMLLFLGTLTLLATESRNYELYGSMDVGTRLMVAWFQSVTARTAGFNTVDIGLMTNAALFIIIALMFIGGSPGGTAGGVKTTTMRVMTSVTKTILQGKEEVLMYERHVPLSLILKAVGVAVGSVATVICATTLIAISDPKVDFIRVLFEVVSAFGTVGLSTGITAALTPLAKLVLVATMYIGRVGILLLMAAVLGDPRPSSISYPEENLLVG
ncbi:MAG: TrkH family potassium uptake protein [Aphanocapsa sp. GSE-SYN-MK-11-07L]|jgi:trk system potassium uptake protein TrkH|nr:TrkH family potassium uptake protein [Aphanocapsa sp. GSE-SYN-MK-11-07L]